MPTLHDCLSETPRRTLLAMAQLGGLQPSAATPKDQLIASLHQALSDRDHVHVLLARLNDAERRVLHDVLAAGNRMPARVFGWRFGAIRPHKPWRDDLPPRPWQDPASPGERPFYMGLLFYGSERDDWGRPQPCLLIPDDLIPHLAPVAPPELAAAARVTAPPACPPDPLPDHACYDVAALLGLLHRADVRPTHGRWIPLRRLRDWNARCLISEPLDDVRSELQTARLRTLQFLAEAAGLVGLAGPYLKPTPRGWAWLEADRTARLRDLWEAWPSAGTLWARYRMPGAEYPQILQVLRAMLAPLTALSTNTWHSVDDLVAAMQTAVPIPTGHWERHTSRFRTRTLRQFLTRFLAHLGVTQCTAGAHQLRVTPAGAWLLGATPDDADPPPWSQDAPFALTLAPDRTSWVRVTPPPQPHLAPMARLAAFARWQDGRYLLTPASYNRARGRGAPPEALTALLEGASGAPLPEGIRRALRAWEQAGARMTLSRPALLECDDPQTLGQLARKRRFRDHVRRTLSPRALILDDAHLGAVVRHLRREGHDPRVLLSLEAAQDGAAAGRTAIAGRSTAAYHWLTSQVYRGLARFVPLPVPCPDSLEQTLATRLPPAELAAAQAGAERVLDALAAAMDGWAPQPSPEPGLDPKETRPRIEAAIRAGGTLRMTYWSAGRGALTHRTITPYRLEQRGQKLYLVAYCHQAQGERVFRLDRIRALAGGED